MKAILAGETLDFAYESLRLYLLCEGMKWAHLPVAGGLYDQHPTLLDEWSILFELRAEHERAKADKEERDAAYKAAHPSLH